MGLGEFLDKIEFYKRKQKKHREELRLKLTPFYKEQIRDILPIEGDYDYLKNVNVNNKENSKRIEERMIKLKLPFAKKGEC